MKKKYNKYNKKQLSNLLPIWDLSDLYPSIKSKKVTKDLDYIQKSSKIFAKKYEGNISKLNSNELIKAIIISRPRQ